ncbi:MAG: glycosyltransferase family 4 protein [Rhodobacteraceae bacterium]|nr:glycosyltransferase family 4 protein [Paracoccaceae bacterium]
MTTPSNPPAICLDVTRLVSRVGRGPFTGIDRVENAYLAHFLKNDVRLLGLSRTAAGYVLLDRPGLAALKARLDGRAQWGAPDLIGRLSRRLPPARRGAEADLRRLAIARAAPPLLARCLARHLPAETLYLNVGHSNLTRRVLSAVRGAKGAHVAVLLHDTIPLDYPEHHDPAINAGFAQRLSAVAEKADTIIANSEATEASLGRHLSSLPRQPRIIVSHLAAERPAKATASSADLLPDRPFFLAVGTVTPRKNQALLLDVWEVLAKEHGAATPTLVIAGAQDPRTDAVAGRVRASALLMRHVKLHEDLSDAAVAALMEQAVAVLHPSFSEGFGFVPIEAALAGTPVICADLSVYREVLGDMPVYADPTDMYHWKGLIEKEMQQSGGEQKVAREWAIDPMRLTWDTHINTVLIKLG